MANTTLSDICIGGGSYGIAASGVDFSSDLPTYLRITDIKDDGTVDMTSLKSVDDKNSWKYKLKPNDIVFARTGASTGRNYFYDVRDGEFVYAGFLIKFSIDPKKANPLFVKYYCKTESYWGWVQAFDTGGTRGNINAKDLGNMPIPIVPREQQDFLAEVLSSLDDRIRSLKQQNEILEALAQTYFRKWFLEENKNDPIPVSDIATLENNSVNPGRQPLESFYHYSIPAFDNSQTPAVELGKAILSNKFCVLPNTILVSKLNPVTPRIWRIGEKVQPNSVCSTEFQVLKPKDMRHYLFLYCLMKSKDVVASFAMSATGTSGSHQRIRPEYILEVETPAPDDEKLALFNEVCAPMMERVKKNQKQILTLQKLRDTLLPKLISGEVRVKQ
ncbi:restriction endonuclease subunit S [Faecalispora jeddahensis]|uniref:restriction endonuclease subunit S n=1 Tax=Faecalispora jeddahensis TaxID=1414721 RepID=UPI00145C176D|nr:restriction endonuclease subunit S [Faecalispora jeddahensis]